MYYLLGIYLALAVLLALTVLASLAAALLWRVIKRPARAWSSAARARLLFVLRTAPTTFSIGCVAALLLPAYIAHEPQHSTETVSVKLAVLASLSSFGITLALWRALATWRATRRLTADWLRHAAPVNLSGINIPAYRLDHKFPVIAIVGAVRPRLFIASQLFETLDPEELAAAVLHEKAHLMARDNFKRPLVRACRDLLAFVPLGRALEPVWTEESEAAADEYAARAGGPAYALSLASALIKIARLIPEGAKPAMPAGAFLIGASGATLSSRVAHLTRLAAITTRHTKVAPSALNLTLFLLAACCFFAFLITQTGSLIVVHTAIEHFVAALA